MFSSSTTTKFLSLQAGSVGLFEEKKGQMAVFFNKIY